MQKALKISNLEKYCTTNFTRVMIPKDKALKLVKIYMYVCSQYQETLNCYCQGYSNNSKHQFSDQEILTIFLFVGSEQRYTRIKVIHSFAKEYLLDWFPGLVSYQTFVFRLNRVVGHQPVVTHEAGLRVIIVVLQHYPSLRPRDALQPLHAADSLVHELTPVAQPSCRAPAARVGTGLGAVRKVAVAVCQSGVVPDAFHFRRQVSKIVGE